MFLIPGWSGKKFEKINYIAQHGTCGSKKLPQLKLKGGQIFLSQIPHFSVLL